MHSYCSIYNVSLFYRYFIQRKKEKDLTQSTEKKTVTENSKKQSDDTKTPPKTSITQRLRIYIGRSIGVTTATQQVWLNRFTGSQPSHLPQKLCYQKNTHYIEKEA